LKQRFIKSDFAIFLYILILSYGVSELMQRILHIDPLDPMGQTSVLALGQLIFWVSMIVISVFAIVGLAKNVLGTIAFVKFMIVTSVGLASGVLTGTSFIALSKTPLYFGQWHGDLGRHVMAAVEASQNGFPLSSYPPLWPTIVGNLCQIFGWDIYFAYKYINLLAQPIFFALTLIILQKVFPAILAESIAVLYVFSFTNDSWKFIGELWTQLFILLLIVKLSSERHENRNLKTKFKNWFLGIGFGLSVSMYYGRLWWIALSISIALLLTNLVGKRSVHIQLSVIEFSAGALIPIVPFFLGKRLGISNLEIYVVLVTMTILMLIRIPKTLEKAFGVLSSFIISISILYLITKLKTGDNYFYADTTGNMIPKLIPTELPIFIFLVSLVLVGIILLINQSNLLLYQVVFLISNILSALLMMLFLAYKMYETKMVELWPRAASTIYNTWELVVLILVYIVVNVFAPQFWEKFKSTNSEKLNIQRISLAALSLLALVTFMSQKLGDRQWSLFPREDTYTMYSYNSVTNFEEFLKTSNP
jgi:hypothetical protein